MIVVHTRAIQETIAMDCMILTTLNVDFARWDIGVLVVEIEKVREFIRVEVASTLIPR